MTNEDRARYGCPECGIGVSSDEDGLCSTCGNGCFLTSDRWFQEAIADARLDGVDRGLEDAARLLEAIGERWGEVVLLNVKTVAAAIRKIDREATSRRER